MPDKCLRAISSAPPIAQGSRSAHLVDAHSPAHCGENAVDLVRLEQLDILCSGEVAEVQVRDDLREAG